MRRRRWERARFPILPFSFPPACYNNLIKSILLILLLLLCAPALRAQPKPDPADDLLSALDQWAQANLDDSVLQALQQIDRDRVRAFLTDVETQFSGTNIYRLAALRDTATQLLPVLQQFEETQPLAVWLQTHFDYFDTAEEMRRQVTVTPAPPGASPPLPEPTPQLERKVWTKNLADRPVPPLARPWLPQLKQAFRDEGAPPELVWVAEVESSFDPRARSPAGAARMVQLKHATARDLGLSSFPWDERLQPEKSARAAARYLRALHRHFGDWPLALAAYNTGENRVDTLLKKYQAHDFDAIARHLPVETQMYVPKVDATLHRREGLTLADLKSP